MNESVDKVIETSENTEKGKFLTFPIGNEDYGIEIKFVTEIIGVQDIIEIPELPYYVKGIINLREKIIPVIDIRLRFRKKPREYDDRTCIIFIDIDKISVGIIVDNVSEVLNINDDNIVPPPDIKTAFNNKYLMGIGKAKNDVKLLFDCDKLLKCNDLQHICEML